MSPFEKPKSPAPPPSPSLRVSWRWWVPALVCVVLGLALVFWEAGTRAGEARVRAHAQAQACAAAVEWQLNQAVAAAEVLGALAKQGGGPISNFQKVATELLARHPGLASLELQPLGVVRDIVPRAGHDSVLGFNVLKDPMHRPGAYAAAQKRALTVTGPLVLHKGEVGVVVRVPIYHRGSDGREYGWGFVAVSMGLHEALHRAGVDELSARGYRYAFYVPAAGQQPAMAIAAHQWAATGSAIEMPVRARNLEFRLALQPERGWVSASAVLLGCLGVLGVSGLLGFSLKIWENRRDMQSALANALTRLAREIAERKQDQADLRTASESAAATQADLQQTQSDLAQSATRIKDLHARIELATREAEESHASLLSRLEQAENRTRELQNQLDATRRAAEKDALAAHAELDQAHLEMQQAQETIGDLEARLEAATGAQERAASAARSQRERDQAALAALQSRFEAATRAAQETDGTTAASAAQWEANMRDLRAQQALLEEAEARIGELTRQLERAQAKAQRPPAAEVPADPLPAPSPAPVSAAAAVPATPPPPPEKRRTARAPRAKTARRDEQMDLFGAPADAPRAAADTEVIVSNSTRIPPQPATEPEPRPQSALTAPTPDRAAFTADLGDPWDATPAEDVNRPPWEPEPVIEPARAIPAAPAVNVPLLRKAVNLMLPLLTDADPGARDCLKANRATFRSAFTSEAYVAFEDSVQKNHFDAALEALKRAARRHGIPG